MRVIFRVDASVSTGTGHLMRCVTLAEALRDQGAAVSFICADAPGNMNDWLRQKNFTVFVISENTVQDADETIRILNAQPHKFDWMVIDHYGLDARWEKGIRPYVNRLFIIDDLADRPHDCDALVDQNFYDAMQGRYENLVPAHCQMLLGPQYALLRPEFHAARSKANAKTNDGTRLLVFFGGSDPTRETPKALEAIRLLKEGKNITAFNVDVVVGASNPEREKIRTLCEGMPGTRYHCQIDYMADLMAQADIAVGAGGTTTWERLCVGLPSIVLAVADNQVALSRDLANAGYEIFLGHSRDVSPEALSRHLKDLLLDADKRSHFRQEGMKLVDGEGTRRIVQALMVPVSSGLS